jgi:hypothetical protein
VNAIPPLPTEISPDGREIWDWAGKFSEAVRSVGPSMNATTCAQYVEKPSTAELRNQRRAELAHLLEHAK